jgi:hypothetical protein
MGFILILLFIHTVYTKFSLLKTCPACRLNTLPEIKQFIREESYNYPIEIVYCSGDPRIVIMDDEGNELETIYITYHKKSEIANLLETKGFHRFN